MRMAKSRRRDTWTEIGRATGPAWSRAQRQSYSERDRQEQMESWGARRGTLHLEKERWPPLTYK